MILSNDGLVAFHYRFYGTFFYIKIGSIISIRDLPTINIIEPFLLEWQFPSESTQFFLGGFINLFKSRVDGLNSHI